MKDDLIALLEAMRLVRAEIDGPIRLAHPADALDRIEEVLDDPHVSAALRHLDPDGAVPTLPDRAHVSDTMRTH